MTQEEYERRRAEYFQNKYEQENYNVQDANIQVPENDISKIELLQSEKADNQMNSFIRDKNGNGMKSSNVILKKDSPMKDGDYLNSGEVVDALEDYLGEDKPNQMVVCKRNGKQISKEELQQKLLSILEKSGGIVVRGRNENITNQNSAKYHLYGEEPKNRTFFLGNKGIELPSGHYIQKEELQNALAQYMVVEKKKETQPVVNTTSNTNRPQQQTQQPEEQKNERHAVVARKKSKVNLKALAAAALIAAGLWLSGLGVDKKVSNAANYTVSPIEYVQVVEDTNKDVMDSLTTGSPIDVQNNIEYFHESDQATNIYGTFGGELRPAGTYNLDHVAVLHNNQILDVAYEEGVNVNDFINKVSGQYGIDKDDLNVMFHLGGPVSGWTKMDDIMSKYGEPAQVVHTEIDEINTFSGTQHNFNGNLELDLGGKENVKMTVVDTQGHLLKDGTIVKASDNQEYKIKDIDVKQEDNGYSVNWSFNNVVKRSAVIAGVASAAGALGLIAAKKRAQQEEESKAQTASNNENKEHAFRQARDNYQKQSKFSKVTSYVNTKLTQLDNKMAKLNDKIIAAQPVSVMNNMNNIDNGMGRHM